MRKLKKILVAVFILLLVTIIFAYFFLNHISNKGIPEYNGEVALKGLKEKVVIRRDSWAIPHIIASNETDLYRATGYVMAQDRLWQMDLLRRVTMGRLSEIFGSDLIKADKLMRSLRISEKSRLVLEKTDKHIVDNLEAFVDGINQYIESHFDKLPPEFTILGYKPEKWKIEHTVNLIGYMAWDLTSSWDTEVLLYQLSQKVDSIKLKQLLPDISDQKTYTFNQEKIALNELQLRSELLTATDKLAELGLDVFEGSNNWAVSGKKSTTGFPILANDMHLGFMAPGIWYQAHQYIENQLDVTGLLLPGEPFVIDGHNKDIAWGMTNISVDDMDFYLEKINPSDTNEYKLNSQWKKMDILHEKILTKEGDTVKADLRFTHRGPVVSGFKGLKDRVVSMRWTGNEYSNELKTVYLLNRARNWDEFKEALKTFTSLGQNVVYADIKGNIGLWSATGIPLRKGDPGFLYPGDTTAFDWTGFVPFDSLPHEYNPPRGYVSSANCRTAPPDYPYFISSWYDLPYRMDRIREMLEAKDKLSIDDFIKMQADFKSKLVDDALDTLVKEVEGISGLDKFQKKAVEFLKNWDGVLTVESQAASIFEYFYACFAHNLVLDEMDTELYKKFMDNKMLVRNMFKNSWHNRQSLWYDNINTKDKKEDFSDIVEQSFMDALDSLKSKFGQDPVNWRWGNLHTLTLNHPLGKVDILDFGFNLNRGPFPVGGSFHTVSPYAYDMEDLFNANHGASHRHIYTTADWNQSLSIIPTGECGIPSSPYYCDQTAMYLKNEYHPDYTDINIIEKNSKFRLTLVPAR
ncbi:MAG: penicillin acylase family protein [Bacteroidales bacterium]